MFLSTSAITSTAIASYCLFLYFYYNCSLLPLFVPSICIAIAIVHSCLLFPIVISTSTSIAVAIATLNHLCKYCQCNCSLLPLQLPLLQSLTRSPKSFTSNTSDNCELTWLISARSGPVLTRSSTYNNMHTGPVKPFNMNRNKSNF